MMSAYREALRNKRRDQQINYSPPYVFPSTPTNQVKVSDATGPATWHRGRNVEQFSHATGMRIDSANDLDHEPKWTASLMSLGCH